MSDLISRADAKVAIRKRFPNLTDRIEINTVLNEVPSVSAERDEWCHDCKEYDTEKHCCPRFNRVIKNAIADAERSGEWIDRESCQVDEDSYDVAICSNCKAEITLEYPYDHYCPNCGARMKGGTD